MRASQALINYLKRREEFAAVPYLDAAGIWTIGYGHVIRPHEKKTLYAITEPQATELLMRDCDPAELYLRAIRPRFESPINQHQFDGVLSFAFNVGLRALEESTLLKLLRAGDFAGAAAQFDRWVYITVVDGRGNRIKKTSRGLVNRRRMDRAIFERGVYAD
jgi:lysozyme